MTRPANQVNDNFQNSTIWQINGSKEWRLFIVDLLDGGQGPSFIDISSKAISPLYPNPNTPSKTNCKKKKDFHMKNHNRQNNAKKTI